MGFHYFRMPYLNELKDVEISSPSNGEVLTYESATSLWKNKPAAGGGIDSQYAEGTTDISIATATWTLMTQMQLTVAKSGTYLMIFSAMISCTVYPEACLGAATRMRVNGTVQGGGFVQGNPQLGAGGLVCIAMIKALTAGQVVDIQWQRPSGYAGTAYNFATNKSYYHRTLSLVKLA